MKKILSLLMVFVLIGVLAGCGTYEEEDPNVYPTSITVSGKDVYNVDDQSTLVATVEPTNVTNANVEWTSSNESVATVSEDGEVTAVGVGTATITATAKLVKAGETAVSGSIEITVQEEKVEVVVPTAVNVVALTELTNNSTSRAQAKVTPSNANQSVVWSSSNENVIVVDGKGNLSAVGVGTVVITAAAKDFPEVKGEVTIKVTVAKPVNVLTIEELQAAAAKEADGKIKIKFRVPFGTNIQTVMNRIIADFETQYPYIDVELEVISGYDDMRDATSLDLQAGTAPDVLVGYPDHFASYLVGSGIIALDSFIKDENVGIWDYTTNNFTSDYSFYQDYINETIQYDTAKSYYALPFNKSTELLIYNKTFFDAYNLKVPTTWDEASALCVQIEELVKGMKDLSPDEYVFEGVNLYDFYEKGKFMPFTWDSTSNLFITAVRQWGGTYTEPLYKEDGSTNLTAGLAVFNTDANKDKTVAAMTFLQEMAKKNYFNVPEKFEKSYASDLFKAGQCVMTVGSSAGISYNAGGVGEMGVAPILYNSNTGEAGKQVIQQGTNIAIMAQASDAKRLAAWLMIKHFLAPENAAIFSIGTAYFPVSEAARNTDRYQQFLTAADTDDAVFYIPEGSTEPVGDQFVKAYAQAAKVDYKAAGFKFFTDPAWSGSSTVRTEVGTAISQILVTLTDINKALADALSKLSN